MPQALNCETSTVGEMWDQFKERMSRDMANIHDPGAAEVSVVAELDLLLLPAGKELCDLMDPTLLPAVPKWKQNKKLKAGGEGGAAEAAATSAPIKYEKTVHGDASAASSATPSTASSAAPAWQEESAAKAGVSAAILAHLLENDARHAEQQQQLEEQRRASEEARQAAATQAEQAVLAQQEATRKATEDALDQLHAATVAEKNNEASGGASSDVERPKAASEGAQQTLERALAASEAATPLPPGWVEAADPRYGNRTYWYHQDTKQTSWTRPVAASPTTATAPPPLPTAPPPRPTPPAPAQPAPCARPQERGNATMYSSMVTTAADPTAAAPTVASHGVTSRIEGAALHAAVQNDPQLEMVRRDAIDMHHRPASSSSSSASYAPAAHSTAVGVNGGAHDAADDGVGWDAIHVAERRQWLMGEADAAS